MGGCASKPKVLKGDEYAAAPEPVSQPPPQEEETTATKDVAVVEGVVAAVKEEEEHGGEAVAPAAVDASSDTGHSQPRSLSILFKEGEGGGTSAALTGETSKAVKVFDVTLKKTAEGSKITEAEVKAILDEVTKGGELKLAAESSKAETVEKKIEEVKSGNDVAAPEKKAEEVKPKSGEKSPSEAEKPEAPKEKKAEEKALDVATKVEPSQEKKGEEKLKTEAVAGSKTGKTPIAILTTNPEAYIEKITAQKPTGDIQKPQSQSKEEKPASEAQKADPTEKKEPEK